MAQPPVAPTSLPHGRNAFLALLASLAAILAMLFAKSFLPEYIVFANDGPLGANSAAAGRMPEAMLGVWADLNWVGNEGVASAPNVSNLLTGLLGPVGLAKVIVPLSLILLGCAAWLFFRQCGFTPWVCTVSGIAAALNGDRFSVAAWGLSMWVMGTAAVFLALAALLAAAHRGSLPLTLLAGFATGLAVMEGFDTGAIFSLIIAGFALFHAWTQNSQPDRKWAIRGLGRLTLIAGCAIFIAAYTLINLLNTQIKGVVGMTQDKDTRERRYAEATTWSLPKIETLRVLIPGLHGYRMNTQDGDAYWGTVGQNPMMTQLQEAAARGDAQARAMLSNPSVHRYSGSGEYAGVLVVLLAAWSIAQALRKQGAFNDTERKLVWFWTVTALGSLLLAFGKYAPFYKLFYSLPYASTIRNPVKFMHPFHLALIILCGYGLQALTRQFIRPGAAASSKPLADQVKDWWATVTGFERRWTIGMGLLTAVGFVGLLLYSSARKELEKHLREVAFSEDMAKAIASFSIGEVGLFVLFLTLSVAVIVVAFSGYWSGRVRWAGVTMGMLIAVDLARANAPWVVYWNYRDKYASNPIIEFLKQAPHEGRVQAVPFQLGQQFSVFQQLYGLEWTQHLFPYNNIQTLDIIQEPRQTTENQAYRAALMGNSGTLTRLWELTNTRFIFGLNDSNFLNGIAAQLDSGRRRFRIQTPFDIVSKPGVTTPTRMDEVTVITNGPGQLALIEFTGALPRTKLFTSWLATTNDSEALSLLTNTAFNPHETVIISAPLAPAATAQGTNTGEVKFTNYSPKRLRLEATATAPSVLLLNDKHSPNWRVTVDGQPATLLRCNYLMRGVQVPAGKHEIEFRYEPSITGLYITTVAIVIALFLLGVVLFTRHTDEASPVAKSTAPPPTK